MSNDPTSGPSTPVGGPSRTTDRDSPAASSADVNTPHNGADRSTEARARRRASREARRRRRKNHKKNNPGLKKKLEFVTQLLKGLDDLAFAELSVMYYMECSTFRLIIRAVSQAMYLSPKSETFPFLMPASRMHVALVVLPNIWCMLVHLLAALPQGYDYNRGYLHGGVIIDFIGQRPPTSRLYFFLADLFLLILQCLMLTIHTERERLRLSLKTFRPLAPIITLEAATAPTVEDLDAEERNIGGGQPDEEEEDVELHSLGRGSQGDEAEGTESRRPNSSDDVSTSRLYDVLSSGNGVLGDHNIVRSMRAAATELERSTAQSLQSIGYGATLAALNTRRENATLRSRPQETTGNT